MEERLYIVGFDQCAVVKDEGLIGVERKAPVVVTEPVLVEEKERSFGDKVKGVFSDIKHAVVGDSSEKKL